ncbi:MAG: MBL fold metallo-hydrolase [Chloroflexi bacterium]|nr:MBL fold metallo-hydrolase [Chloroflexota bacterium]
MELTFAGAAQTVTGSQHLLRINGHRLLLECGLFQGRRADTYAVNRSFPFEPHALDAVILSHAHIDHCGNLPNLVRQGFEGSIHATHSTVHLTDLTLRDSGHIQESDIEFLNKKRARKGLPPLEPLYTAADAEAVSKQLVMQAYSQPFEPVPGVTARLVDAGHILGSAGVVLDLEEKGRRLRLMFSGDIGRLRMPLLRDPVPPEKVDILLMECTYGDKPHASPEQAAAGLRSVLRRTFERGGKAIVPAFAIGRTQLLVYALHEMFESGELPRVPVYVDSPLATNATEIFREHPEDFDEQATAFLRRDPDGSLFGFDLLTFTRSVEDSKAINDRKGPVVIISASGMAETGRILHHLRNNLGDRRNTVLITSWMAPHTLGRRLAEGAKSVFIFGEEHDVRAEVVSVDGFSAHAGQDFLETYARSSAGSLKALYLVHGEAGPAQALTGRLRDLTAPIRYPARGTTIEL